MKVLHLTLKKKWFDMIASGEKKEEYREFKPYWIKRLVEINHPEEEKGENKVIPYDIQYDIVENGYSFEDVVKAYYSKVKEFDRIVFTNGYSSKSGKVTVKCEGISYGFGNFNHGASLHKKVFIIKLGEIIEPCRG